MTSTTNSSESASADNEQTEKDAPPVQVVPGFASFDDYVKNAFAAMQAGIKAANSLPTGENLNYYSCFPTFNDVRGKETKKLLKVVQGIVETSGAAGNVAQRDADEIFELLVEANDVFLDRANACMDEEAGVTKKSGVALVVSQTSKRNVFGSWNATTRGVTSSEAARSTSREASSSSSSVRLLAARNVHRPQLSFKDKIDNSAKPWEPRIAEKPNNLAPLSIYLEEGENGEIFNHPYEFELEKFQPPERQLRKNEAIAYKTLEETPLIVIEKSQDLKILLEDLRRYDEIAIDLEHHSYRTFQGITCLMQISTRDTDYLVDTLSLRSDLHVLNEILTKPTVLKVFHGADSDIQWLQRDLSLYVVNMFDTHQAAKQLDLPYLSLAYLMKRYCNLDPNKHFQLADWRIRPLPEELIKYAREDTHYLLYIKDILINALIDAANGQTNVLRVVYDRSTQVCKRVYEKPVWTEDSYLSMYRKSQKMFNNRQIFALKELHRWRDEIARKEDDSTGYVLPNHMLLNIAETLPREMQGILACCNPIPPLVRQNLLALHKVILKAREQPLVKPVLEQDLRQRLAQRNQAVNSDVWIYSPHDLPSGMEIRANLPCLLNSPENTNIGNVGESAIQHCVTIFDTPPNSDNEEAMQRERILRQKRTMFVSPFERYKRVMPMVAAQEKRDREQQEKNEAEELRIAEEEKEKTALSVSRVHEHFKSVARSASTEDYAPEVKRRKVQLPLSQMHGRKRKKQSDLSDDRDTAGYGDASTPRPALDKTVCQNYVKKCKKNQLATDCSGNDENPETLRPNEARREGCGGSKRKKKKKKGGANLPNDLPTIRLNPYARSQESRKDQKRANIDELEKKGMLPLKNFDYKAVDFSSFQGGSRACDVSKSAQFQPQKQKDKIKKGKKRKKQKINGI